MHAHKKILIIFCQLFNSLSTILQRMLNEHHENHGNKVTPWSRFRWPRWFCGHHCNAPWPSGYPKCITCDGKLIYFKSGEFWGPFRSLCKYPAYQRHWISQRLRIVAQIPKKSDKIKRRQKYVTCQMLPVTCHLSPVTWTALYVASPAMKVPRGLVMRQHKVWWYIKKRKRKICKKKERKKYDVFVF